MLTTNSLEDIDNLVRQLSSEDNQWNSLAIAIDLADEIMKLILPDNSKWQEQLSRDVRQTGELPTSLPRDTFNNQKELSWFHEHPESSSARSAFTHFYDEDSLVESKFYWFSESATKSKISVATSYSPNWEDSELTHATKYKVGIDFFLSGDTNTLLMVTSSQHKLRVLEFNGKLSNTQKQILQNNLNNAASKPDESLLTQEMAPQQLVHQKIWNALQLKEVNKNFYKLIASHFDELVVSMYQQGFKAEDSKQFSSRLLGRLLFVWFLRKMDIINENMDYFNVDNQSSSDYYENHLKTLFFRTLNTEVKLRNHSDIVTPYLNGGLFEAKDNDFSSEKIVFPDNFFKRLYDHFDEFNFTVDESSPDFELIAVDPEMLGKVFESLLASQIDNNGNNERNKKGAFYTPRSIVNHMVKETLRQYLYSQTTGSFSLFVDDLIDLSDAKWSAKISTSKTKVFGENTPVFIKQVKTALNDFKVLDPAVGSGAFPMGMLQLLLKTYERIEKKFDPYKLKLSIIEKNIFGVDIEPMAIEIARLRAWLSVIVDEPNKQNIQPLPNLDFKFISADSLVKLESDQMDLFSDPNLSEKLSNLKDNYFNARSANQKKLFQHNYYQLTRSVSLFDDVRSSQLKSFDPFKNRHAATFFDSRYMFGVEYFDAIIGNPPYVDYRKIKNSYYKNNYMIAETSKMINLYNYFFEMAIHNTKNNGIVTFITPQQYLSLDNTRGVRDLIRQHTLLRLDDFSNIQVFSASTYTLVTLLQLTHNHTSDGIYNMFEETQTMKPVNSIPVNNPLIEPLIISEYKELLTKIENISDTTLGKFTDNIFVASSNKQQKLDYNEGSFKYIESKQIYPYELRNIVHSIDIENNYSDISARNQLTSVVYTSRMTNTIRANHVDNTSGIYMGGKVNVITGTHLVYIEGILNSKIINFWFREHNKLVHMGGGALPINTSDLKKIPISTNSTFIVKIENIIQSKSNISELHTLVDEALFEFYEFSPAEIAIIQNYFE